MSVGSSQSFNRRVSCQALDLALGIYSSAGTSFSEDLSSAARRGDWGSIVSCSVNPMGYTNSDIFFRDYLCAELMSKFPNFDLGHSTSDVAFKKFYDMEKRLQDLNLTSNRSLSPVILTARRMIARLLGPFEFDEFRFMPFWARCDDFP